jgi:hypothetical protein
MNPSKISKYTFTTRGLPGGDKQNLGGHSNWSLNPQPLVLGTTNQISTNYQSQKEQNLSPIDAKYSNKI